MLEVRGLHISYGSVRAVRGVDLDVGAGELVGVVGPNGAGKTSLLRAVVGAERLAGGTVVFEGASLGASGLERRVKRGIRLVPEGRRILGTLTVTENLLLGGTGRSRSAVAEDLERIRTQFPILAERRDQPAGQLSGGEQQMLAIGRALMARPKLLLLDEPTLGLAPRLVAQVFEIVERLRAEGMTMLLVEQNAFRTIQVADRTHILSNGRIALSGTAAELGERGDVVDKYLGASA